jgi:ferric-dicitrate binding protein FerR (iron transport regulator)
LAASVIVAGSGVAFWRMRGAVAIAPVATATRTRGDVRVLEPDAHVFVALSEAASIPTGSRLRTAEGALLSLALNDGTSLRLASNTELVLAAPQRVQLSSGTVYAHNRTHRALAVETPLGSVVDLGTQFEVRLAGGVLRARVRSGSVRFERPGEPPIYCKGGEQLSFEASRAPVLESFPAGDDYWDWMTPLLRPPTIEGMPLRSFLMWVAEELGRSLRFATPDVEARARAVRLHGSIEDLTPQEALDGVLAGTTLAYEFTEDGSILMTSR